MMVVQCQNAYSQGCQVWYAQGCCSDMLTYCAPTTCSATTSQMKCAHNPANNKAYEINNGCVPTGFTNFTTPVSGVSIHVLELLWATHC